MSRIVTFGETMALLRPEETGSLADVDRLSIGIGGAESNVAIGLARLGAKVAWLGRIGADGLGDRVVRELRGEGVEVVAVVDEVAPTGLMIKERLATDTTRPVIYYRTGSAGSRITVDDLPALGIAEAALLHVTGITPALSESARDAALAAIGAAADCRRSGLVRRQPPRVALARPGSRGALPADGRWRFDRLRRAR